MSRRDTSEGGGGGTSSGGDGDGVSEGGASVGGRGGRGGRGRGGGGRDYIAHVEQTRVQAFRLGAESSQSQSNNAEDYGDEGLLEWYCLNDVVMGGKSSSQLAYTAESGLQFTGEISLDGGGFATCRTLITEGGGGGGVGRGTTTLGIRPSIHTAIRLEVTGDGQMYKLSLRRNDGYREPTWQSEFNTRAGERRVITIPLDGSAWHGSVMGRRVAIGDAPPWEELRGVGLTLSFVDVLGNPSDPRVFHDGPFEITVHALDLVKAGDGGGGEKTAL